MVTIDRSSSESDLYLELRNKTKNLEWSVKELNQSGIAYAQAERDYKVLLRQAVLKMRSEGLAVVIIDKTCHGVPEVANARFNRDVAEATYKANLEAINALKLQMRIIEAQIQREWGQA